MKNLNLAFEKSKEFNPEEIKQMAKNILAKIPSDYTVEKIENYDKDYLIALGDLKKEFVEKKNLWDNFVDILAGGEHQSVSERVMMSRWIEGESSNLE